MGEPAGIAPQISLKAWAHLHSTPAFSFFLIGDLALARRNAAHFGLPAPQAIEQPHEAIALFPDALPVLPVTLPAPVTAGTPEQKNAPTVIAAIKMAVACVQDGKAAGLVTNPIAKSVLYKAGFAHPGHTEFLGELARQSKDWQAPRGPVMLLSGGGLRVALASIHIPLGKVPESLSVDGISHTAKVLDQALRMDFGITAPRIALCGLNPHAGEDGALGREEIDIINPAAKALRARGLDISDAQPADALFRDDARASYDAVLAMYHDQGLIPVKTLDFHGGINTTLGLPFIRTSPDHGTGLAIAHTYEARADSLIAALKAAHDMARCRQAYRP